MEYGIYVTNTWTKKKSIYPVLFESIDSAEKEIQVMTDRCSSTGKFKNNEYSLVIIQEFEPIFIA